MLNAHSCHSLLLTRHTIFFEIPGINPPLARSSPWKPNQGSTEVVMSDHDHNNEGVSRRRVLECMTWAGTGVLWTISGGVPRSLGLVGSAQAAEPAGRTFLQISDSHVGFDKPANPNALGTLEEAIARINAMPARPSFMIHTGDITHLSKAAEFDNADRIISQAKLDVHYVPGEHDFLDEEIKFYRERYGRGAKGAGWDSFCARGVPLICPLIVATCRPALSARSAPSNWNGWKTTSRGVRNRRRSWCSRIFHCGPSIRNGA